MQSREKEAFNVFKQNGRHLPIHNFIRLHYSHIGWIELKRLTPHQPGPHQPRQECQFPKLHWACQRHRWSQLPLSGQHWLWQRLRRLRLRSQALLEHLHRQVKRVKLPKGRKLDRKQMHRVRLRYPDWSHHHLLEVSWNHQWSKSWALVASAANIVFRCLNTLFEVNLMWHLTWHVFFILWHSTLTSKAAMEVMERISCQLWALWLGIQVETCRDSPSVDYKASSLFKLNDTVVRFS